MGVREARRGGGSSACAPAVRRHIAHGGLLVVSRAGAHALAEGEPRQSRRTHVFPARAEDRTRTAERVLPVRSCCVGSAAGIAGRAYRRVTPPRFERAQIAPGLVRPQTKSSAG